MDPGLNADVLPVAIRRRRARVSIDLGALKPRWDAWCRSSGVVPAECLRQLVVDALAQHGVAGRSASFDTSIEDSGPRQRVEVRLTVREFDAVEKMAEQAGMSANRWIVAAIRAHMTGEPQFGGCELLALAESSRQMAALGRNLNQIARALNMAQVGPEWHRLEVLEGLRADVDHHLDCVGQLIHANLARWSR